ncbi:MAG: ROK family protein [Candidatus Sumerlaeaceae bacterium]
MASRVDPEKLWQLHVRNDLVIRPSTETPAERSAEQRRVRKHAVLNVIRKKGPISRSEIAKILRFNVPHTSELVEDLLAEKLVYEEKPRVIPRGRWPIPLRMNASAASILGIDIGRTATIAILTNLGGEILARFEEPTPSLATPASYRQWLEHILALVGQRADSGSPPVAGIGVALPGLVASSHGRPSGDPELADELREWVEGQTGAPTIVDNDARMMAYGWYWFGDGHQHTSFAILNVGQGLGLGLFLEGRVYSGTHGFAGEIGYVPAGQHDVPGFLGHPEALENTASGAGLMRLARQRGLAVENVQELARKARDGEQTAREIFQVFADFLGRALATVMNLFDPEAVILAGRICRSYDLFFEQSLKEAERHTLAPIFHHTQISVSHLDVNLTSLGAVGCVMHHIFQASHIEVHELI